MAGEPIRFDDGAVYERGMGVWSQRAGQVFLDWLALPAGRRMLDVGCGNGAFTELLVQRCAPEDIHGIDPSEAQLAFARTRPGAQGAVFRQGDAMTLPFERGRFDAAFMALVIFFVPEPAKGVAELVRVTSPDGIVAAYAWDMLGGGFPFEPIQAEMRALGLPVAAPPHPEASQMAALNALWTGVGLEAVESRVITVERTFAAFDEFWSVTTGMGSIRPTLAAMPPGEIEQIKARVRTRLSTDAAGQVRCHARANAIRGRVPRV